MGATLVMALLTENRAHIAYMGDSRGYLFRDDGLTRLTNDHLVVEILLRNGEITPDEAEKHPARGLVTRYVGMDNEVYPDVRTIALSQGDRLLLCSDGLSGMIPDNVIAHILTTCSDSENACQALVDAAGGRDNITSVVVDWMGFPTQKESRTTR